MTEKERKKRVRKDVFQSAAEPVAETTTAPATSAAAKVLTSGAILRQVREEKGLTLENVCSTIHLRVSQLRAIEEGNLSQLPGMTYAVGFVRSYAKFLKLNSEELVTKFKQENGVVGASKPELHFPAPLAEGNTPGPMVIGVSTVFVVALLVLWAIFSGGSDTDVATDATNTEATAIADTSPVTTDAAAIDAAAPIVMDEVIVDPNAPAVAAAPLDAQAIPAAPAVAAAPASAPVVLTPAAAPTVAEAPVAAAPAPTPTPAPVVRTETAPVVAAPVVIPTTDDQIVVKQPKGRVVLQAKETSWVQITDKSGQIIYKKVMKPGEKFFPPDQPGLSMVTSNAGGVGLTVDGADVNSLGSSGDIIRGVSLDPQSLKSRRAARVRNY